MTDSQYKHLGKAVEAATVLAMKIGALSPYRLNLLRHLAPLIGWDEAESVVSKMCLHPFPSNHIGDVFRNVIAEVEAKK